MEGGGLSVRSLGEENVGYFFSTVATPRAQDPDGGTIYGNDHPRRLLSWFTARRRLPLTAHVDARRTSMS